MTKQAGEPPLENRRNGPRDPWLVAFARQVDDSARAVAEVATHLTKRALGLPASKQQVARSRKEALELLDVVRARLGERSADPFADAELRRAIERLHALRPWTSAASETKEDSPAPPATVTAAPGMPEEPAVDAQVRDESAADEEPKKSGAGGKSGPPDKPGD